MLELVLGADLVYWRRVLAMTSSVMQMPKAGGAPTQVAQVQVANLVVDEPYLYWQDANTAALQRFSAGVTQTIVADAITYAIPTVDATDLFYRRLTTLQRVPKAGGAPVQLAANLVGSSAHLLADATNVYCACGDTVLAVPKAGGPVVTLASEITDVREIAQDASHIYWNPPGRIVRVPKAGGPVETLATNNPISASIAVHGNTLVWYRNGVYATRIGSGVIQKLSTAVALNVEKSVAIDAEAVYFIYQEGSSNNRIVKLQRSADCAPP